MTNQAYLDSCIFIAYSHNKHPNHEEVKKCIETLENIDIELYSSSWSLSEMAGVLIRDYNYQKDKAIAIANDFEKKSKIGNMDIKFVEIDTIKKCEFKDFFKSLKNQIIDVKGLHLADAIHSLIMTNNGINSIITTDADFKVLEKVTAIHPKAVNIMQPKRAVNKL